MNFTIHITKEKIMYNAIVTSQLNSREPSKYQSNKIVVIVGGEKRSTRGKFVPQLLELIYSLFLKYILYLKSFNCFSFTYLAARCFVH